MQKFLTRWFQASIILMGLVAGLGSIMPSAQAAWDVDFQWHPSADPSAVGTCLAGQPATFTASISGSPPSGLVQYLWTFSGCTAAGTCPQGQDKQTVEWTYPEPRPTNSVLLEVRITPPGAPNYESRSRLKSVPVTAGAFTVNILPSAGCTVLAGDGGVDAAEPDGNGIVCSGSTAANDPLCTEQFENSRIASLKVVPEADYALAYWEMNDGIIQQTSAEPLLLTTMPALTPIEVKAICGPIVQFKTMWETANKANQIYDPTLMDEQPQIPKNILYVVEDPADEKYHITLGVEVNDIPAELQNRLMYGVYHFGSHKVAQGFIPNTGIVDILIEPMVLGPTYVDYMIRVGYDANQNSSLDDSEMITLSVNNDVDEPVVHGITAGYYLYFVNFRHICLSRTVSADVVG